VKTNPSQNQAENYAGYFRIGGLSPNDLNNTMVGSYDDVRIYSRSLSPAEVSYLASSHSVGVCSATLQA